MKTALGLTALFLAGCASTPPPRSVVFSVNISVEKSLLTLHNQARNEQHLPPLSFHPALSEYARTWAETMAGDGSMKHSGLTFFPAHGFRTASENIAFNQQSSAHVMDSWMKSHGHRQNILMRRIRFAGFGQARDAAGRQYWCAVFGG